MTTLDFGALGLPEHISRALVRQTAYGAAKLVARARPIRMRDGVFMGIPGNQKSDASPLVEHPL